MKKRYFIALFSIIILSIFAIQSCQDDDICIDAITPRMIISFRDKTTNAELKMDSVNVYRLNTSTNNWERIYFSALKSTIEINLNVNDETSTQLRVSQFYQNSTSIYDNVSVSYENSDEFLSKACGFKRVYKNVSILLNTNTLFSNSEQNTTEISDESQTHLYLYK